MPIRSYLVCRSLSRWRESRTPCTKIPNSMRPSALFQRIPWPLFSSFSNYPIYYTPFVCCYPNPCFKFHSLIGHIVSAVSMYLLISQLMLLWILLNCLRYSSLPSWSMEFSIVESGRLFRTSMASFVTWSRWMIPFPLIFFRNLWN